MFNKNLFTKEERRTILAKVIGNLKEAIIESELNERYLDRKKVTAKDGQLLQLEQLWRNWKTQKEELESKLEVALDELKS